VFMTVKRHCKIKNKQTILIKRRKFNKDEKSTWKK